MFLNKNFVTCISNIVFTPLHNEIILLAETTPVDFKESSFIQWTLTDTFSKSLSTRQNHIEISFRTRQTEGLLLSFASENKMEHFKLEVKNSNL